MYFSLIISKVFLTFNHCKHPFSRSFPLFHQNLVKIFTCPYRNIISPFKMFILINLLYNPINFLFSPISNLFKFLPHKLKILFDFLHKLPIHNKQMTIFLNHCGKNSRDLFCDLNIPKIVTSSYTLNYHRWLFIVLIVNSSL